MQNCNHKKSMRDVFALAESKINEDLAKARKRYKSVKTYRIQFYTFSRVVTLYFYYLFLEIIKQRSIFKMYQRFGNLYAVKTKCTRYVPQTTRFYKDENGELKAEKRYINLSKTNGYVPFIFWDSPDKWRHYRLRPVLKYKRLLYQSFVGGLDYLDYTMSKVGKTLTYAKT